LLYTGEAIHPTRHHHPRPPTPHYQATPPAQWSILIVPKKLGGHYHKLDVTNTSALDPDNPDSAPTLAWRFRNERVDPRDVPGLLALSVLRRLDGCTMADPGEVPRILRGITLPSSKAELDGQGCCITITGRFGGTLFERPPATPPPPKMV
jgi:hypothetical protein